MLLQNVKINEEPDDAIGYILCSFVTSVYMRTVRGHEQSAFKPIVMNESEFIKLH